MRANTRNDFWSFLVAMILGTGIAAFRFLSIPHGITFIIASFAGVLAIKRLPEIETAVIVAALSVAFSVLAPVAMGRVIRWSGFLKPTSDKPQEEPQSKASMPKQRSKLWYVVPILLLMVAASAILGYPAIKKWKWNANRAKCFNEQQRAMKALELCRAKTGKERLNLSVLKDEGFIDTLPKCPEGGKISIEYYEKHLKAPTCSIHGSQFGTR